MSTRKGRRLRLLIAAAALAVCVANSTNIAAIAPYVPTALSSSAFTPVVVPRASQPVPVIVETFSARRAPILRPTPTTPQAAPGWVEPSGFSATYYCLAGQSRCHYRYPDGPGDDLYAAISPDYAEWRGDQVLVCYRDACVTVTIIDCNCQAVQAIDLYADAFRKLAPLSAGRIRVNITH